MMSLFYSFIDCYEKKNGWMSLFLFLVIIYVILNCCVEGVCLYCIELFFWCNCIYFVGRFDMYDYDFYLMFIVILFLFFNGFCWLLS